MILELTEESWRCLFLRVSSCWLAPFQFVLVGGGLLEVLWVGNGQVLGTGTAHVLDGVATLEGRLVLEVNFCGEDGQDGQRRLLGLSGTTNRTS